VCIRLLIFSILYGMYILILSCDLGYGQLLVLDVSLSILLEFASSVVCTLMSKIIDYDEV